MRRSLYFAALLAAAGPAALPFEQGPLHDPEDRVIHYNRSDDLADPVAILQKRLAKGTAKLDFEPSHGYLVSLLRLLKVPQSSQALVFSKTSLHGELVSPRTPRALYFNDSVYVGWSPDGEAIDVSAEDPTKGPIFYTLDQRDARVPRFTRDGECMQCHLGPKTLNVPGHLLRSVLTAPDGRPVSQVDGFTMGHGGDFKDRWGGWYVTGTPSGATHLGNSFLADPEHPGKLELTGNLGDLRDRFDTSRYLTPDSDIVALLLLAHQVKMHNLITRANYETRYAVNEQKNVGSRSGVGTADRTKERIAHVAEPLLEYMLFRDEARLSVPVQRTSSFAEDFQHGGPRDSKGRSLRQLDLNSRLLRYPCSYLIYSEAFDGLPPELKEYLWQRLFEILSGQDESKPYAGMSIEDREAVLHILLDTKPEFAAWVRQNRKNGGADAAAVLRK